MNTSKNVWAGATPFKTPITIGLGSFMAFPLLKTCADYAVGDYEISPYLDYYSNITSIVFALILGTTMAFLFNQRQTLNQALYSETVGLNSLFEEILLVSDHCRSHIRRTSTDPMQANADLAEVDKFESLAMQNLKEYILMGFKEVEEGGGIWTPVNVEAADLLTILISKSDDPVENLRILIVGSPMRRLDCECVDLYATLTSVVDKAAIRLACMQNAIPDVQWAVLVGLAVVFLAGFPLAEAGNADIGMTSSSGNIFCSVPGTLFACMSGGLALMIDMCYSLNDVKQGLYNVHDIVTAVGILAGKIEQQQAELSQFECSADQALTNGRAAAEMEMPSSY